MVAALSIAAGPLEARFLAKGGALLWFTDEHGDVVRAGTAEASANDPREAACFPCVPYFGRVYGGVLRFDGRAFAMGPTLPHVSPDLPLHGEGWARDWTLVRHDTSEAALRFTHDGAAAGAFPYAFSAEERLRFVAGALEIVLSLTNEGPAPMPAGLGLHPYFARDTATTLGLHAARFWTPPSDGGHGVFSCPPEGLGRGAPGPLPEAGLDHSFAGLEGAVLLEAAGARIRLETDAPILHVYAPAKADFVCLEPVSHLPGALVAPDEAFGGARLAPGARMSVSMRIRREASPR